MSLKMAPSGDRGTPPLGGTAGIERAYPSALAFRLNRAGAHSRKIGVESQDVSATSFVVGTTCGATEWVDGGAYNQRDVRVRFCEGVEIGSPVGSVFGGNGRPVLLSPTFPTRGKK